MINIIKRVALVFVIMIAITFLAGCGKDKITIVGSWEHDSYVYTFKDDNTGSYVALGTKYEFTYEDSGTSISMLYTGNTAPLVLEYKIEGNKLIIKDSFGSDVEYTRK